MPSSFDLAALEDPGAAFGASPGRVVEAREYMVRLRSHFDRWGISRVADITGLDRLGLPVVQAVRPEARSNIVTQGKGATLAHAAIGAVLECVEMAAGEDLSRLAPGAGAIAPDLWRSLAPRGSGWPGTETPSLAAWDVKRERWAAVPAALVSTDFARGAAAEAEPVLRHSIGLGAGATLADAAWHGLLECIENDARLRADAAGRLETRPLRLAAFQACAPLLALAERAGLRAIGYDLTARSGPPVVMVRVMEDPASAPALPLPADGYGCRLRAEDAAAAALAEALQARLAVISGAREDISARSYAHDVPEEALLGAWEALATPFTANPPGDFTGSESVPGLAAQLPSDVFVVPLVHEPEVPLAVVRVLAPGLWSDPLQAAVL